MTGSVVHHVPNIQQTINITSWRQYNNWTYTGMIKSKIKYSKFLIKKKLGVTVISQLYILSYVIVDRSSIEKKPCYYVYIYYLGFVLL